MASIAESIGAGANEFFSNLASTTSYFAIIVVMLAVGFGMFILIVHYRRKFDFEGSGEPLGHFKIEIMGKYTLEGNIAKWQNIDPDQLNFLRNEEKLNAVPDVINQMYNEGNLFIYTMKNPDDSDIMDKLGNRTFIISSGDLDSKEYSYRSQKSKLTIRNIFTKESTRTVIAYSSAYKAQVLNEDRNLDDWWIIAPIPMVKPKELVGFNNRVMNGLSHHIEIKEITNAKSLASALDFAPYVIKAQLVNEQLKTELNETNSQLERTTKELIESNQKIQKKTLQLGLKPYVIGGKEDIEKKQKQNLMMVFVAVIMGSMTVMFLPQFFKSIPLQSAQFLGMVIALAVVGGISYMMNKQKPEVEDE